MADNPLFFHTDDGVVLEFVLTDPNGIPHDLTGATVTLLVETVDEGTGLPEFPCTILDALAGRAAKTVVQGEFTPGRYRAHVRTVGGGTVLHSDIFTLLVSEAIDAGSPSPPPAGNPSQGAIPFGAIGGGEYTESVNFKYAEASNVLQLFGGVQGTGGQKLIALGLASVPSTFPADTIQIGATDISGAATAGLNVWVEGDEARLQFGTISGGVKLEMQGVPLDSGKLGLRMNSAAVSELYTTASPSRINISPSSLLRLSVDQLANVVIDPAGVYALGTNAAGVLYLSNGTPPTTSPTNKVGLWADDRNGAATADLRFRTEEGHSASVFGWTLVAADNTERTTTSTGAVDLSTPTFVGNIPAGEAFVVVGKVRKSAGAAASASLGAKVNGSQVWPNTVIFTATNQAEDGTFSMGLRAGACFAPTTNYTNSFGQMSAYAGPTGTPLLTNINTNATPGAGAVTSIVITGLSGSASVTLAVDDIKVYRLAGF